MKGSILLLLLILSISGFAQKEKNLVKVEEVVIKVKADSLDYEIKNGKLAYLNDCEWVEYINVNGNSYTQTHKGVRVLIHRVKQRTVSMNKIKKTNPDGTFKYLAPVKIIFE